MLIYVLFCFVWCGDLLDEMRSKEYGESSSLFFHDKKKKAKERASEREKKTNKFNQWFPILAIIYTYMSSSNFLWCQWWLGLLVWVEVIRLLTRNNANVLDQWLLIIKTTNNES